MVNLKPFRSIFSSPVTSVITFIIAVIALNTWQLILPNFHFDNSFSVAAARNVSQGMGYVTTQVLPTDLSQVIYEPINKWPPGYSWLVSAIMPLAKHDVITAVYVVNAISIFCFVLGIYFTLMALKFPRGAINGFILFVGFFPYPFLGAWFADLAAVAFFTLGIGLIMHAHATKSYIRTKGAIAAMFCAYCLFLKYLYLPVTILPLVVWGWYALRTRQRKQFAAAIIGAMIVMTASLVLLWYQSKHSGQPVYVNPTGRGFFPEHLLEMGAVIPASLVDQDFMTVQLGRILHITYGTAELVLRIINYIMVLCLFYWIFKWWRSGGSGSTEEGRIGRGRWNRNLYAYIVLVVSAATAGMLAFMSLTFAPYIAEFTPFWTYLEELRYYAIVIVFIQQWVFWYFVVNKPKTSNWVYRGLRVALVAIVFIGISHSAYYLYKQAVIKKQVGIAKVNEQTDLDALRVVEGLAKQYPDLVICSNNHELVNIASLAGVPVLYEYNTLNGQLKTSKPVTLVAILRDDFGHRFTQFFDTYKPVKVDHRYNFSFYLAHIR